MAAATVAIPIRPTSSWFVRSGPNRYIKGSEVYPSCRVYNEPNPNAEPMDANQAARRLKPSVSASENTATAAAALLTTAYIFHLTIDEPGRGPSSQGTSTLKQWMSEQSITTPCAAVAS